MLFDPYPPPSGASAHDGIGRFVPDKTRESRIYEPVERPRIWALHGDGRWYPGWLHAWIPGWPQLWWGTVTYHSSVGLQHYLALPAPFIRQRTDDQDDPNNEPDAAGHAGPAGPAAHLGRRPAAGGGRIEQSPAPVDEPAADIGSPGGAEPVRP